MANGAEVLIQGAEGEKPRLPHSAVLSRIPGRVIYPSLKSGWFLRFILVRSGSCAGLSLLFSFPFRVGFPPWENKLESSFKDPHLREPEGSARQEGKEISG